MIGAIKKGFKGIFTKAPVAVEAEAGLVVMVSEEIAVQVAASDAEFAAVTAIAENLVAFGVLPQEDGSLVIQIVQDVTETVPEAAAADSVEVALGVALGGDDDDPLD